jgi:hypothetical protein
MLIHVVELVAVILTWILGYAVGFDHGYTKDRLDQSDAFSKTGDQLIGTKYGPGQAQKPRLDP